MWNMRRSFDLKHIPCEFVLYIEIADARQKRWWFVVKKEDADLCWSDPGFEVADLRRHGYIVVRYEAARQR